jgi:hypothetical protein
MFQNEDGARTVCEALLNASLILEVSARRALSNHGSEEEQLLYAQKVQAVLDLIDSSLLVEIYKNFPNLKANC